jgi:predicted YcjX-like family ATPase
LKDTIEQQRRELDEKNRQIVEIISKMESGDEHAANKLLEESLSFTKKCEEQHLRHQVRFLRFKSSPSLNICQRESFPKCERYSRLVFYPIFS